MPVPMTADLAMSDLRRLLSDLSERQAARAEARALNRTARQIVTVARRTAAREMGLPQSRLRNERGGKAFSIDRARPGRPMAIVSARGKHFRLIEFTGTRRTRKGVSSAAWGARKLYPGTFTAAMPTGFTGAFKRADGRRADDRRGRRRQVRSGTTVGKWYRPALPIKDLWGPSLPKTMAEGKVEAAVRVVFAERMPVNLAHEVDAILRGVVRG